MNETTKLSDSPREFLSNVERLLAPVYIECFSEETRKTRNLLLIVSFVLILSAVGLIAFGRQPTKVPTIGISVIITSGMRWVLLILCGYLLALHSTRSYTEWNLWRLRHQAPMMEISDLATLVSSQLAERYASVNAAFSSSQELYMKLDELRRNPPELLDAERRLKAVYQEHQRLGDQLRKKQNQLQPREFEDEAFKVHQLFEEFMRLDEKIKRQRKKHEARIAFDRDTLERRLRDAQETHSTETAAPELKAQNAKLLYLADAIRPVKKILSIRLLFEVFFPTAFAIAAMLIGVFAS